jgi:ATP-binding cassette subfamily B (MDR/TAP) protein 1
MMHYTAEKIAKSVQATSDLYKLIHLTTHMNESRGTLRPALTGSIKFENVGFAYPERPEAVVLRDLNLEIREGECVAVVGASGSGKSTIAGLLQRLYEPDFGSITVGCSIPTTSDTTSDTTVNKDIEMDTTTSLPLASIEVHHLRNQISVVSQHPNLFDATVADNIRYGNTRISDDDVHVAAKMANVHDFVMGLPQGYDTMVGENAALVSGGQAQRLQIARALARPSRILILDECTSALDGENQGRVLETIRRLTQGGLGRTTVMVTHKVEVMKMCDRVVVVGDGAVLEEGSFEELVKRKGVFAKLASGGEWVGE